MTQLNKASGGSARLEYHTAIQRLQSCLQAPKGAGETQGSQGRALGCPLWPLTLGTYVVP